LAAYADTVYTYTGNSFTTVQAPYTTSDFISGSFTVAAPLAANIPFAFANVTPLAYSFSDGLFTYTDKTSPALDSVVFSLSTNATGAINTWNITVGDFLSADTNVFGIRSFNLGGLASSDFGTLTIDGSLVRGSNTQSPGAAWVVSTVTPSSVPEPSSLMMMGTGIVTMFGAFRRENARR